MPPFFRLSFHGCGGIFPHLKKGLSEICFAYKTDRFVRLMASSSQLSSNRLADEKSPYLLQHANNPVDWYPWGPEAFNKARDEKKPIFLSVGYSTCHWCHVMERESFENPAIGRFLNEHFVSIKVDREERPDVDKVYMTFVQATTGGGGWPMSVWLTPDLKPIVGGTYFPPDDRYYDRPGFKSVLTIIAKQWSEKRDQIENQGTQILDALMQGLHVSDNQSSEVPSISVTEKCFETVKKNFDSEQGGFGKAPKFPQPVNINFLLRYFSGQPDSENGAQALQMSLFTLQKMADGGLHDHISQGFHRYSTDRNWHVPHFEKMLYDQGQLAVSYADAYQITKDSFYAGIAKDIFTYVNRDLSHPAGGFFSAEDADSLPSHSSKEKKEGAFCVWQFDEIKTLLSEKIKEDSDISLADIFCYHYGVVKEGNVDPLQDPHEELTNQNILIIKADKENVASKFEISSEEVKLSLDKCQQILFKERQLRPKPHLDDKMVAAWNGLMISGFSRGGQVLNDSNLTSRAIKAAAFLRQHMFIPESCCLLRSCYTANEKEVVQISNPIKGFVDDYAFVIRGLLDLYETCYDESWLAWAEQLQTTQNDLFWDEENGAYFSSPEGDNSIVLRIKEDQDGAEPSPNSVSAMNLVRLSSIFDQPDWRNKAERIFKTFSERLDKLPFAVPELVSSLMFHHSPVKQVIIVGDKDSDDTKQLLHIVHSHFLPNKILLVTDSSPQSFLTDKVAIIKSLSKIDGKATAYVCENFTCSLPVNSPDELEKQLTK